MGERKKKNIKQSHFINETYTFFRVHYETRIGIACIQITVQLNDELVATLCCKCPYNCDREYSQLYYNCYQ